LNCDVRLHDLVFAVSTSYFEVYGLHISAWELAFRTGLWCLSASLLQYDDWNWVIAACLYIFSKVFGSIFRQTKNRV